LAGRVRIVGSLDGGRFAVVDDLAAVAAVVVAPKIGSCCSRMSLAMISAICLIVALRDVGLGLVVNGCVVAGSCAGSVGHGAGAASPPELAAGCVAFASCCTVLYSLSGSASARARSASCLMGRS